MIVISVTKSELVDFILMMEDLPVNMSENEYDPEFDNVCGCLFVQYVLSKNPFVDDFSCSAGDYDCIVYDSNNEQIARYDFECIFSYFGIPERFSGFKV